MPELTEQNEVCAISVAETDVTNQKNVVDREQILLFKSMTNALLHF